MPAKEEILRLDRDHLWHPFTQASDYAERDPVVMVGGRGVRLFDADGRAYYDAISSWWTNTLGHAHPRLVAAAARQAAALEHVNFSGFTHPPAADLVAGLVEVLPPALSRYFFSDDGSTAVEAALKMAFQYWRNRGRAEKTRFIMVDHAYHGDTLGAVGVGGVDLFHRIYRPLTVESFRAPGPDCARCPHRRSRHTGDARDTGCALECFDAFEALLREKAPAAAALILEPLLQGAGGMLVHPPLFLQRARALASELDLLLILDEVATGFGRTGTLFAFEQAGVVTDLLCLSKGLTGGFMPLALTVATEEVFQSFYGDAASGRTFFHGHSYTANPVACAVGAEHLRVVRELGLPRSAALVLDHFHRRLKEFAEERWVSDIRHLGFVGAVDLAGPGGAPLDPAFRAGWRVYHEGLARGVVLRPLGDTLYWFLPLVVTREEVDAILDRSRESMRAVLDGAPR